MTASGCFSDGVSGTGSFLVGGTGVVGASVVGLGLSRDWSPSKLVWLVWHGSLTGD